ncbi:diguanylate cyclase domain-containing protein [Nitrosophilus labii]|uniref:diguanylate cyclase domain-containing protein n=1 Tax=Nitrosophilus labii TaxID=2706014 RepID=UPI0016576577|nr:diguanylate cyclase [Nitrosophilus labii]
MLSRTGGNEFTIIASNTDLSHAKNLIIKLKNKLERDGIKDIHEKICCSFGITEYKKRESKEEFFKRANKTLYISKKRNKTEYLFYK